VEIVQMPLQSLLTSFTADKEIILTAAVFIQNFAGKHSLPEELYC
jgi:hypothetical protein